MPQPSVTPALIRPMQPGDEAAVGRIAFATGYFGNSAARYFPAPELFAALWVGAYFRGGGFGCFVAEQGGEVVGYILGAPDDWHYQQGLRRTLPMLRRVLPPPRPLLACLRYLSRMLLFAAPHGNTQQYPAHLHINLLPAARGQRLGERLLQAHLDTLYGAGVAGVQLSTTSENRVALGLYRKLGFTVLAAQKTRLWQPWLGRTTTQIVMGRKLWQPEQAVRATPPG